MPRRHRPVPSACLPSRRNRPHSPADDRAWADAAPRHATLCEFLRKQEPSPSHSARRPGLLLSQELASRGAWNGVPPLPAGTMAQPSRVPAKAGTQPQPQRPPSWAPAFAGARVARRGERDAAPCLPGRWLDPPEFLRKQEPSPSPSARRPGLLLSQELALRGACLPAAPTRHAERVSASIVPPGTVGAVGRMDPERRSG